MTLFTNRGLDEATGLPNIHVATFPGDTVYAW
jgi:hypothetical protein